MATAQIYVDAAVGRPAVVKALATPHVHLTNFNNAGVATWAWTKVQAPPGSAATFNDPTIAAPEFGPFDLPGTYWIRLAVNAATGDWQSDAEVDEIVIRVRTAVLGLVYPAIGETTQGSLTTGWADWASGMNDALTRIAAMTTGTLQAAYTASVPPRITIDPAAGPVYFRRLVASPGNALVVSDEFGSRIVLNSNGRLSLVANIAAGTPGLAMTASGATGYMMRLLGAATREFSVGWDGAGVGIARAGVGSPLTGWDLDCNGYVNGLFQARDSTVILGSGVRFLVTAEGGLACASVAPDWAISHESHSPTMGLVYLENINAVSSAVLTVRPDASLQLVVDDPSANIALEVASPGNTNLLAQLQDTTNGGLLQLAPAGALYQAASLGGAAVGQDFLVTLTGAATALSRIRTAGGDAYLHNRFSQIVQTAERAATLAGTMDAAYRTLDLSIPAAAYTLAGGKTRQGYRVNGSVWDVTGGRFHAYLADLASIVGASVGFAHGYHARMPDQYGIPFSVGIGAGDTPFLGYYRFCAADGIANPAASWSMTFSAASGTATNWYAAVAGRQVLVPLHIPHGATLIEVSVHVQAAAAGLTMHLIEQSGAMQQQHAAVASLGAGEQDLVATGLTLSAARAELGAAAQNTFYISLTSTGVAPDRFYFGYALFEYNDLLLGE